MISIKLMIGLEEWYDYIDKDNILHTLSRSDKMEYIFQVLDSIVEWGLYTNQKVYPVLELLDSKSPELKGSGVNDCFYFLFKEIQKEHGIKGKNLFMGSRIILTGQMHGPDLPKTMEVLGKETCLNRIKYVKNNVL